MSESGVVGLSPISALCKSCLESYSRLCDSMRGPANDGPNQNDFDRVAASTITLDAQYRFKGWAYSIAALQNIRQRSSLDFRLQSASDIRKRVVAVLTNLHDSLFQATLIASGERQNETWGPPTDSEDEGADGKEMMAGEISEIEELFSAIELANKRLLKLSMLIRNSPARDDYSKAATRYNFDSRYDVGHVKEKIGPARESDNWIAERLGKAITRRRQFLQYRREHHGKLFGDWEEAAQDDKQEQTIFPSTKATTFIDSKAFIESKEIPDPSVGSQTSYEPTIAGDIADGTLNVPPPPKMAFGDVPFEYGEPFLCPFCYTEQIVESKPAWKKHVFRDLKPYVCTFKECSLKMFKSRNEWFAHELQNHRRDWHCPCCGKRFNEKGSYSHHLNLAHYPELSGSRLEALILQSEGSMETIPASACLFCDNWKANLDHPKLESESAMASKGKGVEKSGTTSQFRRHLGRHMEQLALFALPMNQGEEMEDESSSGSIEEETTIHKKGEEGLDHKRPADSETDPFSTETRPAGRPENQQRMMEWFVPGDGIDKEVITADICRYLGNDALVRPGLYTDPETRESRNGYFVTAYRIFTREMIADLQTDSERWRIERAHISKQHEYRNDSTSREITADPNDPIVNHDTPVDRSAVFMEELAAAEERERNFESVHKIDRARSNRRDRRRPMR